MVDYDTGIDNSLVWPRLPPHKSLLPFPPLTNFPHHHLSPDCYMVAGGLVAYDEDGYKSVISGTEDPLHAVRTMEFAKVHSVMWVRGCGKLDLCCVRELCLCVSSRI